MAKKKKKADEKPKKKSRAAELDDDDFEDGADGDDFDDAPAPRPASRNDAYTGMLLISLVCLVAASVLLMLDSDDMTASPLANPTATVPALVTPAAAPAAL